MFYIRCDLNFHNLCSKLWSQGRFHHFLSGVVSKMAHIFLRSLVGWLVFILPLSLFFFQPVKIYFLHFCPYLLLSLAHLSLFIFSNLSVFLSVFSITIEHPPICSTGNKDRWKHEWGIGLLVRRPPHKPPLALFLSPVSQTVTWQSAEQRCDSRSSPSRSNTKRLLIFIKSSLSRWNIFVKENCTSIIREQCVKSGEERMGPGGRVLCVSACIFANVCVSQRHFDLCFAVSHVRN